jgi:hypothetical protein
VVEFTSSTLSPLAQAQARAERRASMSPEKNDRTRSSRGNVMVNNTEADKENRSSSPSLSLSPSPSPSPSPQRTHRRRETLTSSATNTTNTTSTASTAAQPQPQRLSPTKWTRAHWLRLDELLQARKRGSLQLQLLLARSPHARLASSSTSSPSGSLRQLLGKQVTAQGERMEIQAWHLDVVEGFLGELGGNNGDGHGYGGSGGPAVWGGTQIAKRVFALLVGEERRRLGLVPSSRGDRHGSASVSASVGGWEAEREWAAEEDEDGF